MENTTAQIGLGENAVTVAHEESSTPAAPASSYISEVPADASSAQAAALKFIDANRAAAVKGGDVLLQRNYQHALDVAFRGAAPQGWLTGDAAAPGLVAQSNSLEDDLAAGMKPMHEAGKDRLITLATVKGAPPEIAAATADFAYAAALPPIVAEIIAERVAHHHSSGWGAGEQLSEADHAELWQECCRAFGGEEKATHEAQLARSYLESVGGASLLALVDQHAGSLGYDPRTISQLAHMARARGLEK